MTLEELVAQCKCEVTVTFNPHTIYYETVEDHLGGLSDGIARDITDDARAGMIAANRIVEVQWYPDTPIGFCITYGPSLDYCLARIEKEGIR